jgi:hypothetical protein
MDCGGSESSGSFRKPLLEVLKKLVALRRPAALPGRLRAAAIGLIAPPVSLSAPRP